MRRRPVLPHEEHGGARAVSQAKPEPYSLSTVGGGVGNTYIVYQNFRV